MAASHPSILQEDSDRAKFSSRGNGSGKKGFYLLWCRICDNVPVCGIEAGAGYHGSLHPPGANHAPDTARQSEGGPGWPYQSSFLQCFAMIRSSFPRVKNVSDGIV